MLEFVLNFKESISTFYILMFYLILYGLMRCNNLVLSTKEVEVSSDNLYS